MARGKKTGGRVKGQSKNKRTVDFTKMLDKHVDYRKVLQKLFELSQGVQVQVNRRNGPVIYTQAPSPEAAKILIEQRFGKPQQKIELDGEYTPIEPITGIIIQK